MRFVTPLDTVRRIARRIRPSPGAAEEPQSFEDMGEGFSRLYAKVSSFSMASVERMYAVHQAANYLIAAKISGDFVECGVWRGGSSMMAALTAAQAGDPRLLWLYDTFTGMTEPSEADLKWSGETARAELEALGLISGINQAGFHGSFEDVEANMARTGYPEEKLRLVRGAVEETIPHEAPEQIALLRLDTDWYESTKHELEHLWPRLVRGGVLIIDDYGHWQGARKAVDEYFVERPVLLHRVDYTGRMVVKL